MDSWRGGEKCVCVRARVCNVDAVCAHTVDAKICAQGCSTVVAALIARSVRMTHSGTWALAWTPDANSLKEREPVGTKDKRSKGHRHNDESECASLRKEFQEMGTQYTNTTMGS